MNSSSFSAPPEHNVCANGSICSIVRESRLSDLYLSKRLQQSSLLHHNLTCVQSDLSRYTFEHAIMTVPDEVDIIVCGGGSAGCVPAGRKYLILFFLCLC